MIEEDGLLGVINRSGKIVVTPQFSNVTVFDKDTLIAELPEIIDLSKPIQITGSSRNFRLPKERRKSIKNRYGASESQEGWANRIDGRLYNIHTGWVETLADNFLVFDPEHRDYIWASQSGISFQHGGNQINLGGTGIGLIRPDGSWISEIEYKRVKSIQNGIALASRVSLTSGKIEFVGIDSNGKEVFTNESANISNFEGEFAQAERYTYEERKKTRKQRRKLQQYGLINKSGELMGGRWFSRKVDAKNGTGQTYVRSDDRLNYKLDYNLTQFSKTGEIIRDDAIAVCKNYILVPTPDKKMQVLNHKGELLLPYKFDAIWGADRMFDSRGADIVGALRRGCEIPSGVHLSDSKGRKSGTLLPDGTLVGGRLFDQIVFSGWPRQWVKAHDISDGKWGLMTLDGHYHLPAIYDNVHVTRQAIAVTKNDRTQYYIPQYTPDRVFLDDGLYDEIPEYSSNYSWGADFENMTFQNCPNNFTRLEKKKGLWGLVDHDGSILVEQVHRALSCFANGTVWAPHEIRGEWCQIDKKGSFDLTRPCKVTHYKNGSFPFFTYLPKKFDEDPFESSVQWMQAALSRPNNPRSLAPLWLHVNRGDVPDTVTLPYEIPPE